MTLEERRRAEFPQYERPLYWGVMRKWRVALLQDWLDARRVDGCKTYLDVGCGPAESLHMGTHTGMDVRGCDVVQSVCNRDDVDLIPGAHDLGIYADDSYDIVTCNDVLEHLLEEDIPAALSEMSRVAVHRILLGISRKPGTFHICIQSDAWWMNQIHENIRGVPTTVYADRIPPKKQPYLWVDIECP